MWRWVDDTSSYITKFGPAYATGNVYRDTCSYVPIINHQRFYFAECLESSCDSFWCERTIDFEKKSPIHPVKFWKLNVTSYTLAYAHLNLVKCPDGHVVHDFLSCDSDSHCGIDRDADRCALTRQTRRNDTGGKAMISVEMFHCHQYGGNIPYTLVCDFRNDCPDKSDEEACAHKGDSSGLLYAKMKIISVNSL